MNETLDDDLLDLRQVFNTLKRNARLIAAIVVSTVLVTFVVTLQLTPLYTATATVLIDTRQTNVVDVEAVMSGLSSDSSTVDSQVEIIRSQALGFRVVEELRLVEDPEFNAARREASWWDNLHPSALIGLLSPSTERNPEELALSETLQTVNAFRSALSVRRKGRTNVISIDFTSASPYKAEMIANAIADAYLVDQLETKYEAAQRATEWLDERLEQLREQVRTSEQTAELFRSAHGLIDADGSTITEQQLREINSQLLLARAELDGNRARLQRARGLLNRGSGIDSIGEVLSSEVIRDLRREQSELVRTEAQLRARYGDRHPRIIEIRDERRDLESQIRNEVDRIIVGLENEVAVAATRVASLERSLETTTLTAGEREQDRVRLRELQREATSNRTLYENFLNRFKETRNQEDLQEADARIISRATLPLGKSSPKTALNLALAFVAGGIAGIGIAFLREFLDDRFHTASQVEEHLDIPVLSTIPLLDTGDYAKNKSPATVILEKPLSSFTESFRELQSSLSLSDVDNPPKSVLFTSALPNEGKTTTSISFAASLARSGQKVILIDADLRRPSVKKYLHAPKHDMDLIDLLAHRCSRDDATCTDEQFGFDMLTANKPPANPHDLLTSDAMKNLLDELHRTYDMVIIDTAPTLPVSDAKVLSPQVDKVAFVIKWQDTPTNAADQSIQKLMGAQNNIAGAVFTQMDMSKQSRYSYGDASHYYNRYSDYYLS